MRLSDEIKLAKSMRGYYLHTTVVLFASFYVITCTVWYDKFAVSKSNSFATS